MSAYPRRFHSSRNSESAEFQRKLGALMKAPRTPRGWGNIFNGQTVSFFFSPVGGGKEGREGKRDDARVDSRERVQRKERDASCCGLRRGEQIAQQIAEVLSKFLGVSWRSRSERVKSGGVLTVEGRDSDRKCCQPKPQVLNTRLE